MSDVAGAMYPHEERRTMELSEMRDQVADFDNRTDKLGRRL
jgi:hypothetical protein